MQLHETDELHVCRSLFPESICLFMYRGVLPVANSVYRMSMVYPSLRLVYVFGRLSAQISMMLLEVRGLNDSDFRVRMDNDLTYGVLQWTQGVKIYLEMRRRGFDVSAVRYEDLVARPLDMCRVILEFCRLPVSLAELAVKALDRDSQGNSSLAKSNVCHLKAPQLTPRTKAKLNELLKRSGVPLIGEPGIVEGTLGCR